MKIRVLMLLIPVFLIPCCEEQSETYKLTITVLDTDWTPFVNDGTPVSDAVVSVYKQLNDEITVDLIEVSEQPVYHGSTDQDGVISFNVLVQGDYYVIVNKNNLSNVISPEAVNGKTVGYIIDGIFKSQAEIDSYVQLNASLGDVRVRDLNGDGVINSGDRHIGYQLYIEEERDLTIWIADKSTVPSK